MLASPKNEILGYKSNKTYIALIEGKSQKSEERNKINK